MSQSPSPSTSNALPSTSLTSLSHTNQPSSSSSSQDPSTPHTGGGEDGEQQGGGGGAGGQGMPSPKAIIKSVDMNEEMQQEAVDVASAALEKFNIEKDIAMHCKKEFDRRYGSSWHCVVGKNYGSFVTHETKHFIYFYLGQIAILLWKSS